MPIESNRPIAALVATIVIFASVKLVSAQQELRDPVAAAPTVDLPPDTQGCVLLQNDNVLFGSASQLGDFVIVRRGQGNEIRLPRKDVACWADSVRNLYRYRVDHRPKQNVGALVKDARWCLRYDLNDLAELDLRSALQLDRRHPEALRLQRQLERRISPTPTTVSYSSTPLVVKQAGYRNDPPDLSGADLHVLASFARDIQPMLANRCGTCHSHTSSRDWKLTTHSGGARVSARTTRENLSATMRFIDRGQPESSELWVKAVTPHGGAPAALDLRRQKAMTAFQQWLGSLTGSYGDSVPRPPMDSVPRPPKDRGPTHAEPAFEQQPPIDDEGASGTRMKLRRVTDPHTPARLPRVANPFDPDLFNRRYHPE
jgi:hypothetical protein